MKRPMRRPPPPPQVPKGGEPATAKGGESSEPAYLRPTGERAPLLPGMTPKFNGSGSSPDVVTIQGEMAPLHGSGSSPDEIIEAFCGVATVFLADYHLDGVAELVHQRIVHLESLDCGPLPGLGACPAVIMHGGSTTCAEDWPCRGQCGGRRGRRRGRGACTARRAYSGVWRTVGAVCLGESTPPWAEKTPPWRWVARRTQPWASGP